MDLILIVGALVFLAVFIFLFIGKPYYLVAILIFMMVYIFNLPLPGPLDARGLLLTLLLGRLVFFDKQNFLLIVNVLLRSSFFYLVFIFIFLSFIVTNSYQISLKVALKDHILALVCLFLGFIIFSNKKGRDAFTIGLISAGLVSVFDLVLHYILGGYMADQLMVREELTLNRFLDVLVTGDARWGTNHNFPGYLSGCALIFVYLNFFRKSWKKIYTTPLMILLGIGVILSTSRSTLIAVILVIIYISISQGNLKLNFKRIITGSLAIVFVYVLLFFTYNALLKSTSSDNSLLSKAYYRLYEEPLSFLGTKSRKFDPYLGNIKQDNFTFRIEKAKVDVEKFFSREYFIQMFGYGRGGYKYIGQRIFQDYNNSYILWAHNGYVLILVENGIIGMILFFVFTIGLIIKSLRKNKMIALNLPVFYLFIMIMIYVTFQNGELSSSLSFLLIGGMISNVSVFEFADVNEKNTDYARDRI